MANDLTQEKEQFPGLPSFKNAPVVEVVYGVLFNDIAGLSIPHMGLWWQALQPEFPYVQEYTPIPAVIEESLYGLRLPPQVQLLQSPPLPRVWFVNEDQSLVVQLQRDRFLANWRKTNENPDYPRYEKVMDHFISHLEKFKAFLADSGLGGIEPRQYELTYVNHLPLGEGWDTLAAIGDVFPDVTWRREKRFLPDPEAISFNMSFKIPHELGRLHIGATPALREADKQTILQLTLTVRGIGKDTRLEAAADWFSTAREWIVLGFRDIASEHMRKDIWRMEP